MTNAQENKTFDFATAVKYLLDGRSVRVVDWGDGIYISFFGTSMLYAFYPDSGRELNTFSRWDFTSEWELYNG